MVKKLPPIRHDVTVEHNGKQHTGSYTVQSGVVSVSSFYGSKATQLGGSDASRIARRLLIELVIANQGDA
jgi:hypothetical protein